MTTLVVHGDTDAALRLGIEQAARRHPHLAKPHRWWVQEAEDGVGWDAVADTTPPARDEEPVRITPPLPARRILNKIHLDYAAQVSLDREQPPKRRLGPRLPSKRDPVFAQPGPPADKRVTDRRFDELQSEIAALRRDLYRTQGRVSIDDVHEDIDALVGEPT